MSVQKAVSGWNTMDFESFNQQMQRLQYLVQNNIKAYLITSVFLWEHKEKTKASIRKIDKLLENLGKNPCLAKALMDSSMRF